MTSLSADGLSRISRDTAISSTRSNSERTTTGVAFDELLRTEKSKTTAARKRDEDPPQDTDAPSPDVREVDSRATEVDRNENADQTDSRASDDHDTDDVSPGPNDDGDELSATIEDDVAVVVEVIGISEIVDQTIAKSVDSPLTPGDPQSSSIPDRLQVQREQGKPATSASSENSLLTPADMSDSTEGDSAQDAIVRQTVEVAKQDDTSAGNTASELATDVRSSEHAGRSVSESPPVVSRLSQQLLGQAERSHGAAPAPDVDPSRFIHRVANAVQSSRNADGEVRLRLSPPELGTLRVEVKVESGALTARIEAETNAARNLLLDNLPLLRDRLAERGIHVERFDVDVPDRQSGDSSNAAADQHRDRPQAKQTQTGPEANRLSQEGADGRTVVNAKGQLNVIV